MAIMTIEEMQADINGVIERMELMQKEMLEMQHLLDNLWWALALHENVRKQEA